MCNHNDDDHNNDMNDDDDDDTNDDIDDELKEAEIIISHNIYQLTTMPYKPPEMIREVTNPNPKQIITNKNVIIKISVLLFFLEQFQQSNSYSSLFNTVKATL